MGRFERHFAGEQIKAQTFPRAPARQLADTGQGFGPQALAEAGGALSDTADVLFKWNEREGNSEYDTLRGLYASEIGAFDRTSFKDTTTLEAGFKKLEANLTKLPSANELKNKSGLKKYKAFMTLNKEARDKVKAEKSIRMVSRNLQSALFINLSNVAQQPDRDKAMDEIETLIKGGLDDGSIKTATQGLAIRDRFINDWTVADVNRRSQTIIRADGEVDWSETVDYLNQPENTEGIDSDILDSLKSSAKTQNDAQQGRDKERLEAQREIDRGTIYDGIHKGEMTRPEIEATSLDEDEQSAMWEMTQKEAERKAKGELIVTDPKVRQQILRDITGIITGATTRADVTRSANDARFGNFSDPAEPTEPTISNDDYDKIVSAIEAQYEQGFGQMMSKVERYANGILLNPDSLGFIKNAPVRYQSLGDFEEAWLAYIAKQGDKLKLADIYPDGRRLAASFQISDTEAERREKEIEKGLRARETGIEKRTEGETIAEYLKRTGK